MEPLTDPIKDRVVKTIKPPPHRPLTREQMFPEKLKCFLIYPFFSFPYYLFFSQT